MSELREAIRSSNRLARMRLGQSVYEEIEFDSVRSPDGERVKLAQVVLTENETQQGVILAASLDVPDNIVGINARNRVGMVSDLWHSLRDPGDLNVHAFESIEQMIDTLLPTEIDVGVDQLAILMDYASPALDGITEEDLNDLKKAFEEVELSELYGRRWAAVKLCFHHLLPEVLQAKLSGSTSTESSTPRSESEESTSAAAES